MQCKDIPDQPILDFIGKDTSALGCTWFGNAYGNSVTHAMPLGTPPKLALAKMRSLIRRKLVDGCACGCRGDFKLAHRRA